MSTKLCTVSLIQLHYLSFSFAHRVRVRFYSGTSNGKVHWRDAVAATRDWAQGLRDKMTQLTNVSTGAHLTSSIFTCFYPCCRCVGGSLSVKYLRYLHRNI